MDSQTIETYNQMAQEYDAETVDFWERFPRTFFDQFIHLVKAGTVLDIGAGPGRDGLILQKSGLKVVCLDASEAMVKLSTERGLESIVGDFLDMPFDDESFEGVWAYTSLLHVPKKEVHQAMKEIRRVLKPKGFLGLGLIEGTTEEYKQSSGMNKSRWFSFYTKSEIQDFLKKHDFQEVYFEEFQPKSKKYLNFIAQKKL